MDFVRSDFFQNPYFSDQEKLLKFEAEGQEFAKNLRSLEQFIQTGPLTPVTSD